MRTVPAAMAIATALSVPVTLVEAEQEEPSYQQPSVEQQQALSAAEVAEASAIFERLVADYRSDPMAVSGQFGIKVADSFWTVDLPQFTVPSPMLDQMSLPVGGA